VYFFCGNLSPADSGLPSIIRVGRVDKGRKRRGDTCILKVVGDDGEAILQRNYGKSGAVQADLEEIHLLGVEMSVGVDISEAPLESKGDEISLSRQRRREAEAILLEDSLLPRRANLSGRVVRVAVDSVFAEHRHLVPGVRLADLLAGLRVRDKEELAVVGLLSSVEGTDVTVEEGTLRVGARVVSAAVGDARLGEGVLKEGDDLGRHDVGHEAGDLLLRDVARRHGGAYLVVPGVVIRHHEGVDEVGEDDLLVGSRRVGLPEGSDLLHGSVEKGGIGLGQARLNCGHFSRF